MDNVISLEVVKQIRALKKFADRCKPLNKRALYEFIFEQQKLPEEVVEEVIRNISRGPTRLTEIYTALSSDPKNPYACPVFELAMPVRGELRTFEGMGKKGALLEGLYWLLLCRGSSIVAIM